jgi:hypothetical protein
MPSRGRGLTFELRPWLPQDLLQCHNAWTEGGNDRQAAKAMRDEEIMAEIQDFIEGFNQPTYRGMRINGQRVATWSSQNGWSGDSRPEAEWMK